MDCKQCRCESSYTEIPILFLITIPATVTILPISTPLSRHDLLVVLDLLDLLSLSLDKEAKKEKVKETRGNDVQTQVGQVETEGMAEAETVIQSAMRKNEITN